MNVWGENINMINFIINYWWIFLIIIAIIVCGGYVIYKFLLTPSEEQLSKIKEWLLYAVTEAEKELGSGTGKIKLRYVYDLFLTKFTWLSKIIAFDTFSDMVDEVLETFRTLLNTNTNLQSYIASDE